MHSSLSNDIKIKCQPKETFAENGVRVIKTKKMCFLTENFHKIYYLFI